MSDLFALQRVVDADAVQAPPHWPIAAFTGHRKITGAGRGLDGYDGHAEDEILRVVFKLRDVHGCTRVRSGMAIGGDTRWAWAGIAAGLELEAHIPGLWQPDRWSREQRDVWRGLLTYAADTGGVFQYDDATGYNPRMFYARNEGLLAGHPSARRPASVLVAALDHRIHTFSGTLHTYEQAIGREGGGRYAMPVIHIDPTGDEKTHMCVGLHCGLCEHAA